MSDKSIVSPGGSSYSLPQPIKTDVGDVPKMDLNRSLPRQISTGSMRGTQTVGYGNTKIDGSNNTITIAAPDGSVIGMGAIPFSTTNEYGFFSLDINGKLSMKIVNGTFYTYDTDSGLNTVQVGVLPNGVGGIAASNDGYSVDDGF